MNPKELNCYDFPHYYEAAFSFRDISQEVDTIERTIREYAKCEVKSFLELACGPAFHMVELSKRGYHFSGLDLNEAMLTYASEKADKADIKAEFIKASMIDFRFEKKVDFVFIALGSLYASSTNEVKAQFDSVALALNTGGLFLLDWCVQFDPAQLFSKEGQTWEVAQGQTHIRTSVIMKQVDKVEQLFEEQLEMEINDGNTPEKLKSYAMKRAIYPQEFLLLINNKKDFEFIGWWNNWDLDKPLSNNNESIFRPIVLLRKI